MRRPPLLIVVVTAALVAAGCTGDSDEPADRADREETAARLDQLERIPCDELVGSTTISDALGRAVEPEPSAARGSCVYRVSGTPNEFVTVAVSGPAALTTLREQAPNGTTVKNLGDQAIFDTAIPIGARLLARVDEVEAGITMQVSTPPREELLPIARTILEPVVQRAERT